MSFRQTGNSYRSTYLPIVTRLHFAYSYVTELVQEHVACGIIAILCCLLNIIVATFYDDLLYRAHIFILSIYVV
jgi:hypothetical protein